MRKIILKNIEEKKNKTRQLVIGGVLVFIMLLSTVGYSIMNKETPENSKKISYNGLEFVQQNNYWFAEISGVQFAFRFNPRETEEINSNVQLGINNYAGKSLYISSDNFDAEIELYRNLDSVILRRQYACLENETCKEEYPVKTCQDNFILIKESNNSRITQENNCVFIEGNKNETVKLVDKFLYKILRVQ